MATLVIAAGAGIAAGIASNDTQPVLPDRWAYPTSIEGLIDSGLIPARTLRTSAVSPVAWPYPTSMEDLIERGLLPSG